MGKKKAAAVGLGRALLRERRQGRGGRQAGEGWLHTSELNNGPDWGCLKLQSVTEQSSLEEFLATAELAGTEFVAEKLNIKLVPAEARTGLLTVEEIRKVQELHNQNRQFLCIPRRPPWDKQMSPEELSQAERDGFLVWRRQLARLEEEQKLLLTPFERNLDFWRQLWRVLERSDVVVQIVDARNPLLFRCQDLERYVKELSPEKENLILLNKADLLTEEQRFAWARFFEGEGVKVAFWSALLEGGRLATGPKEAVEAVEGPCPSQQLQGGNGHNSPGRAEQQQQESSEAEEEEEEEEESEVYEDCEEEEEEAWLTCSDEEGGLALVGSSSEGRAEATSSTQGQPLRNSSRLLPREELLGIFRALHAGKKKVREGELTVGLVGYPNVGKSSTINTILGKKKVSVSATPGRTKHFQTLYVEPGLCLCDCPGLVMPSFVATKAEMTCSGILPIDQLRDHVPPVSLVCQRIPRHVLEATYGISIIRPREDEPPDRQPTAEELLAAYGCTRGFMTDHGRPDQPRSARYVLKDYVSGKLLYCHPPPGVEPVAFQRGCPEGVAPGRAQVGPGAEAPPSARSPRAKQIENPVDKAFFLHQESIRALTRGVQRAGASSPQQQQQQRVAGTEPEGSAGKPWKKHGNRNKREKVRRRTQHLEA